MLERILRHIDRYREANAVLATMHGKKRVVASPLFSKLGLIVETLPGINTDQFSSFADAINEQGRTGVALAVNQLMKTKNKVALVAIGGTSDLTKVACTLGPDGAIVQIEGTRYS